MASTNKLIFFFLFTFSSSVFSSAQLSVDFKATSFQQLLKTNTGLLTSTKFSARNVAGRAVYGLRTVPIGKAIVGNVLKNRSFSPWGFAITAAITAAGYFIDSGAQTINGPAVGDNTLGTCNGAYPNSIQVSFSDCEARSRIDEPDQVLYIIDSTTIIYRIFSTSSAFAFTWRAPEGISPQQVYDNSSAGELTDDEIYDAVVPNFSESDLTYALNDPNTGIPDMALTPLVTAATDLTNDYDAENDNDSNTNPTEDGFDDTGSQTFTEDPTQLPTNDIDDQQQSEQQDQCELTPDALGCQEFGDELTEVDIPTEELPFSFNAVSLSSDTSCPSPTVMSLTYGDISLSNQPLCDFLTGINPVVIAVCSILSIYLLVGGVQRG